MSGYARVRDQSQTLKVLQGLQEKYLEAVNPTPSWYDVNKDKVVKVWERSLNFDTNRKPIIDTAEAFLEAKEEDNLREWDIYLQEKRDREMNQNTPRTREDAPGSTIEPGVVPTVHLT